MTFELKSDWTATQYQHQQEKADVEHQNAERH
jgi:hypothetical protein